MNQDDPDLEQRLSRFEAQLDRFSLALHRWQKSHDDTPPPSPREDVDQRIRTLEETLDREADALRRMHEEPLKQLQAHAMSLRNICIAASNSVNGLDQAESRFAALQADVQLQISDLSRNLQALVADLRNGTSAVSAQGPAAAWPLERVVDLHDQLRRTTGGHAAGPSPGPMPADRPAPFQRQPPKQLTEGTEVLADRVQWLEHAVTAEKEESSREAERRGRQLRTWYMGGIAGAVATAVLAFGAVRWIEGRLNEAAAHVASAEHQATAATQLANQQVVAARQDADRQIAEARLSAQRAETVGAVLTAPDLVRFSLSGGVGAQRPSALMSWSRTRGLVLSASRLPAAPPETTYQLWLVTGAERVSAGLFVPDTAGRATLVIDAPPRVAGPVVGAEVTVEPDGGRQRPSGPTLLARLP
jgi:hypothetical protein